MRIIIEGVMGEGKTFVGDIIERALRDADFIIAQRDREGERPLRTKPDGQHVHIIERQIEMTR